MGLSIIRWPSTKQSTVFISSHSYFEFLSVWIRSKKDDLNVCVLAFLCSALSRFLLNFFLLNLFLEMLRNFATFLFSELCWTTLFNWLKTSPASSIVWPKTWCLYKVYKPSTVWYWTDKSSIFGVIQKWKMKWELCVENNFSEDKKCNCETQQSIH